MKAFVTGTDGYIGCMLAQMLLERGHTVTGCDTGFHRSGWLYNGAKQTPPTLTKRHSQAHRRGSQGLRRDHSSRRAKQ